MAEIQAVMKKLEEIRNENANLYEKISELKKFSNSTENEGENLETPEELEKVLTKERQSLLQLKKEYTSIIMQKNELDAEIEQKNIHLSKDLLPQLRHESDLTQQYYTNLISKIESLAGVNIESMKELISTVQEKRNHTEKLKDEYEKMKQFIAISKYTQDVERDVLPDIDKLLKFDKNKDDESSSSEDDEQQPDESGKPAKKKRTHKKKAKKFRATTLKPGSVAVKMPRQIQRPIKRPIPIPSGEH